jgi:hypothetical protein
MRESGRERGITEACLEEAGIMTRRHAVGLRITSRYTLASLKYTDAFFSRASQKLNFYHLS